MRKKEIFLQKKSHPLRILKQKEGREKGMRTGQRPFSRRSSHPRADLYRDSYINTEHKGEVILWTDKISPFSPIFMS